MKDKIIVRGAREHTEKFPSDNFLSLATKLLIKSCKHTEKFLPDNFLSLATNLFVGSCKHTEKFLPDNFLSLTNTMVRRFN